MSDERSNQSLIKIRADATGFELSVGAELPSLFSKLIPRKFRIRREADDAIVTRLLQKIQNNEQYDESDLAYAEQLFTEEQLKYVRRQRLLQRAYDLCMETPLQRLLHAGEAVSDTQSRDESSPTSGDWVNKFREDISLVDDEVIREIYARICAEEAWSPKSFSLQTLGVLRYLDGGVADGFARLRSAVINGNAVPQRSRNDGSDVLDVCGLSHADMVTLNEVGLVNSAINTNLWMNITASSFGTMELSAFNKMLLFVPREGKSCSVNFPIHLLTTAGKELFRIATSEPSLPVRESLVAWAKKCLEEKADVHWADTAASGAGATADLDWTEI